MMKRILALAWASFLVSPLYSALLPNDAQIEEVADFSGGLNTTISSHKLKNTFSPNMKNVFIHRKPGSVIDRNGYIVAGSSRVLQDGRFGFVFAKENGEKEFIVSDSSMVLSTKDFNTYVFVSSGLDPNLILDCAQVRNKVWCTNGTDPVFTWDGTTRVKLDGTNGTPNVPRFRYIDYWQERVFGLNTSANGSSLDFSAVITTDNIIIAPDDSRAWPSNLSLNVGRGDGQLGTALFVYKGRLFVGKESSAHVIYGNSPTSYKPDRILSDVGPISNDSVVQLDNLVYFKGLKGVYAFNGSAAERITDLISPDMDLVNNAVNKTLTNIWDTQTQFLPGIPVGTTVTASGFVQNRPSSYTIVINNPDTAEGSGSSITFTNTQTAYITTFTVLTSSLPLNGRFFVGGIDQENFDDGSGNQKIIAKRDLGCLKTSNPILTLRNLRTGNSISNSVDINAGNDFYATMNFPFTLSSNQSFWDANDVNQGSFSVKIELFPDVGCKFYVKFPTVAAKILLTESTTGQYISDVATLTSVTSWGVFDAETNPNGGSVNFFTRTSTSSVNITTQVWTSQAPGTRINAPTINNYVQWASTIAHITTTTVANVDFVTIAHIEGSGSKDRPFGISWNKELWMGISTGSTKHSIEYVKSWNTNSVPNAWNRLYNQDIRSLFKDGESTLYAGSASTGVFYRLDYGTNDNGNAISSIYDTPDMYLNSDFLEKKLYEVWVDVKENPSSTFTLGISTDSGAFKYLSQSISGSDRNILQFKNVSSSNNTFRFRFQNSQTDKPMEVHGIAPVYIPQQIRSER